MQISTTKQPEAAPEFLITLVATAGPDNEAPDGRRYPILAFALGEDEAAAVAVAHAELARLGWIDVEVLRTGDVVKPDAVPEDFRAALEVARRWGCGLIIYDEP